MIAVPFDTLKLARALHFTPEQAEGAADAIAEAVQTDLATKADLSALGSALRADIAEAKSEIINWTFGTTGVQTIIFLGGVVALLRLVKP
ncbi:MAG: hypothetical protein QOF90_1398 [Acetobacteraceae bacterium]|nr:hypothetical protein [Acetobacteraceae bacterium]